MASFAGRFLLLGDDANDVVASENENPGVASIGLGAITIESISTDVGSSSADPKPHAGVSSASIFAFASFFHNVLFFFAFFKLFL